MDQRPSSRPPRGRPSKPPRARRRRQETASRGAAAARKQTRTRWRATSSPARRSASRSSPILSLWSTSSVDDDKPFHAEPKSESEKQQLVTALKDHYVFSALSRPMTSSRSSTACGNANLRAARTSAPKVKQETSSSCLAAGECDIIVKGEKVGSLQAGSKFGELALLYSCTRAATIKATSSCTCWAVDAATFRKVAIRSKQGAARGRLDFLKKVPLLQGLDSGTLQRVADALKRVEFAAGSKIVTEGEPGDDFT